MQTTTTQGKQARAMPVQEILNASKTKAWFFVKEASQTSEPVDVSDKASEFQALQSFHEDSDSSSDDERVFWAKCDSCNHWRVVSFTVFDQAYGKFGKFTCAHLYKSQGCSYPLSPEEAEWKEAQDL